MILRLLFAWVLIVALTYVLGIAPKLFAGQLDSAVVSSFNQTGEVDLEKTLAGYEIRKRVSGLETLFLIFYHIVVIFIMGMKPKAANILRCIPISLSALLLGRFLSTRQMFDTLTLEMFSYSTVLAIVVVWLINSLRVHNISD